MKSLVESIFDKDLSKQSVYIGNVFELDEWTIPARGDDYSFTDDILNYGIKPTYGLPLDKSHWKKLLKPLNSFPKVYHQDCLNSHFLKYITEIILCCETVDQIQSEVRKYIMECKNNPNNFIKRPRDYKFIKDHVFKDVQVQTLDGLNGEMLRMVVIKFIMENDDDYVICVTFKKRD